MSDIDLLRYYARVRNMTHKARNARTHRSVCERWEVNESESDVIGIAGEIEFGRQFDLEVDFSARPGGDNGIDFTTPLGTIDVKTFKRPFNLPVPVNTTKSKVADILVLAGCDDDYSVTLIGWTFSGGYEQWPVIDFGFNCPNYCRSANLLRPIAELRELMNKAPKPRVIPIAKYLAEHPECA